MIESSKKIAILAADNYQTLEVWYSILRLREDDHHVDVIGRDNGENICESKVGYPIRIDYTSNFIEPANYDGVIIPGGFAPDMPRRDKNILKLVSYQNENKGLIAAICRGAWVLVSADVVEGREMTSLPSIRVDVENAGAQWKNKKTVVDENLITARLPKDLPVFLSRILFF